MNKKISYFFTLCLFLNNHQIISSSDNPNTALGLGLFISTALFVRNHLSYKQSQRKVSFELPYNHKDTHPKKLPRNRNMDVGSNNTLANKTPTQPVISQTTLPSKDQEKETLKNKAQNDLKNIGNRYKTFNDIQALKQITAQKKEAKQKKENQRRQLLLLEQNRLLSMPNNANTAGASNNGPQLIPAKKAATTDQRTTALESPQQQNCKSLALQGQKNTTIAKVNLQEAPMQKAIPHTNGSTDQQEIAESKNNSTLTAGAGSYSKSTIQDLRTPRSAGGAGISTYDPTIKYKKNHIPNFSQSISSSIEDDPYYRYKQDKKPFLTCAINQSDLKLPDSQDSPINRVIKQVLFEPNGNHDYFKLNNRYLPKKSVTLFYIPGSYDARLHGTHEAATLDNEEEMTLFAKKLAIAENATVKVVYFQWDGALSESNRLQAGQNLAQAISENSADQTITISHSHGGNVVLHAAQTLKQKKKIIDHAVLFGCPLPDAKINIHANNINRIFNIYSEGDCTAALGSFLQTANARSIYNPNALTTSISLRKEAKNIINVQFKHFGDDPSHKLTASKGLENLSKIMKCLDTQYPEMQNIIVNADNHGVIACLDNTYYHPKVTLEMEADSKANAQSFKNKYDGNCIYQKGTMQSKFENEIGQHLHPHLHRIAGAAIECSARLIHNPVDTYISQELERIKKEPNLSEQTKLFFGLQNNLYENHSLEDIQQKLQCHKAYNELRINLERQQLVSECIIGKTRTYDKILAETTDATKVEWLKALKDKIESAQTIYANLNDQVTIAFLSQYDQLEAQMQNSFMQDILLGYEQLDLETQQALLSALPSEISDKVNRHLNKALHHQVATGYMQGVYSLLAHATAYVSPTRNNMPPNHSPLPEAPFAESKSYKSDDDFEIVNQHK